MLPWQTRTTSPCLSLTSSPPTTMAGVATFQFNPVFSPTPPSSSSSYKPPSASFAISSHSPRRLVSLRRPTVVQARLGGSRPGPSSFRRGNSRQADNDPDAALDISSIRSPSVRLIDAQQNMIGVVSRSQAIQMAEDAELDLVILSSDSDPPVLRIMDYKKYKYEQQKKKRDQQKKSSANRMEMKELKMGYNIDSHDYSVRLKAAQKFLKDGDKVKIIVNMKGRENEFKNIAIELIKRFQNDVGELAKEESKSFRERNIFIVLVPNKTIQQRAAQEQTKNKEKTVTEASTV